MSTRTAAWPRGTPSWVDVRTEHAAQASAFYSRLFGWKICDTGEETGHYRLCLLGGRAAAGIGALLPGVLQAPAWTTYLAVEDAQEAARAVATHGGTVIAGPMAVGEEGWMALARDPTGALFGVWQAGRLSGEQIANEPGAVVWNECMSLDADRARRFYSDVFGYTYHRVDGIGDYSSIDGDGPWDAIGGIGEFEPSLPLQPPAHWMTYFQVADADFAAAVTDACGGRVRVPPFNAPFGRMAMLSDPEGAVFSIVEDLGAGG